MPITVTWPQPGQQVGSGYEIRWSTDRAGPFEVDEYWQVSIREQSPGELVHFSVEYHNPLHQMADILHVYPDDTVWRPVPIPAFAPQTPVQFVVQLRKGQALIQEEQVVDVVYDPVGGWPYQAWIAQQTTTQGFTEADRGVQLQIQAMSAFNLSGGFLPALPDALDAILPFGYSSELITPDRTGGGVLQRPGGLFGVNALGIRWQIMYAPPGIGLDEGGPPSFEITMVELGLTKQLLNGVVMITDSHEWTDDNGSWVWNFAAPHQVLYWMPPGVVVRFYWLLFGGSGTQLLQLPIGAS